MMTLTEYLNKQRKKHRSARLIAKELGLHDMHLAQLKSGKRQASMGLVLKIEEYTGFIVNRYTLRPDWFSDPKGDYEHLKVIIKNVG